MIIIGNLDIKKDKNSRLITLLQANMNIIHEIEVDIDKFDTFHKHIYHIFLRYLKYYEGNEDNFSPEVLYKITDIVCESYIIIQETNKVFCIGNDDFAIVIKYMWNIYIHHDYYHHSIYLHDLPIYGMDSCVIKVLNKNIKKIDPDIIKILLQMPIDKNIYIRMNKSYISMDDVMKNRLLDKLYTK